jgi:large subunit ribosomal protein L23
MSNKTIFDVIRRPVFTEKSVELREDFNQVTFEVAINANKIEIRKAVEALLEVEVSSVNTMIVRGKTKRIGRHTGKRPNWKKAIVTLAEGETIPALDLVDQFDEIEDEGEE